MNLASELVRDFQRQLSDVTALAGTVLDLSPEQRERLERLRSELEQEKSRLIADLNGRYADRVREALDADQGDLYDGVLETLRELATEAADASEELRQALGREAAAPAGVGRYVLSGDPAEFLHLSPEKQGKLQELREAMHRALHEALQQRVAPERRADPEAWRQQREQFRAARQEAEAEYEAARAELLTPEQRERLERIEAAIERHNGRVREARRRASARLLELLAPDAPE
ncbi:MAG: hypothetical protein ACYS1C_05995 [Planctomycetota bacterium]